MQRCAPPRHDPLSLQVFHGYVALCNNGTQDLTRCVVRFLPPPLYRCSSAKSNTSAPISHRNRISLSSITPPLSQVKAEINCGSRRTQLTDNSNQPVALIPAKAT